jgi:MATE family multidrug resistance protein
MYASLLAVVANVAGNYVLMYGKLGLPALGAVGCGVATAIVMWLMLGFMAFYIRSHREYERFQPFSKFELPAWPEVRGLVRLGAPIAVSMFMEASLFSTAALVLGSMGAVAVAGHQIALNVASVTFMIPLGLAMAITARVGQAMGRGDAASARYTGFVGIILAGMFMALSAVCIFLFPGSIATLYTRDSSVHDMAVQLLFAAAIFQISDGLQVSSSGALRGLKDTKTPMLITVIAYWLIGFPLGYTLAVRLNGGPQAMWIGFIFGLTTAAVLLSSRFHFATRTAIQKQRTVKQPQTENATSGAD